MNDHDFEELVESIKQAGQIKRGELEPSRRFEFSRPLQQSSELLGDTAVYQYIQEDDFLEIFFQEGEISNESTATIELTDNIVLRFDSTTSTPLSLACLSFSKLVEPTAYGEKHFALLVEEWPDNALDKIWQMLRQPPLTGILRLGGYIPTDAHTVIPMTTMNPTFAPDLMSTTPQAGLRRYL
ncbi:MAG: hypothetical protein AAF639_09970 [Chloroflexota bacterium]